MDSSEPKTTSNSLCLSFINLFITVTCLDSCSSKLARERRLYSFWFGKGLPSDAAWLADDSAQLGVQALLLQIESFPALHSAAAFDFYSLRLSACHLKAVGAKANSRGRETTLILFLTLTEVLSLPLLSFLSTFSFSFLSAPSGAAVRRGLGCDPVVKDTDGN